MRGLRRPSTHRLPRGLAAAAVAAAVLAGVAQTAAAKGPPAPSWTPPALLAAAQANPDATFRVIVRAQPGDSSAVIEAAFQQAADTHGHVGHHFRSIAGVSGTLTGAGLTRLAGNPHVLSIVPDAPMLPSGVDESTLWRGATEANQVPSLLAQAPGAQAPAIAVVDSGVDSSKTQDFGSRLVADVSLSSDNPNATGDDEGHGTMVAGIAAGAADAYPGVVPSAPIVSIRTAAANGASHTSDVIAAVDWILQNKSTYNIRVANFSLVSDAASSFVTDPLDAAVEQLWFNGIVVVAAVGNYGQAGGVLITHAPGNDPFVISVGALDTNGTVSPADDFAAPWSAYGHTGDGFAKPELSAPGRWIVAPVPEHSSFATAAPDRIVAPGYMWMSGTSLAAPVVSGAAAAVLALHPDWTPGQVKGALMESASALPAISGWAGGVGEVDAAAALGLTSAGNADASLDQFVVPDSSGVPRFDGPGWEQAVQSATDWSATDWSATDWSATDWSATDWSATDWSATDWSATDWSATDWSATDWSATDWSATDWSATDWSAAQLWP
jgi:serine protease AprX